MTCRLTQLGRVDAGEPIPVNRVESVNCIIAELNDLVDVVRKLVVVVTYRYQAYLESRYFFKSLSA